MSSELWRHSAVELGQLIAHGESTSVEIVDAHLQRIADANPATNAITRTQADEARTLAATADQRHADGNRLGPLDGVPFTTKENIDCLGVPTTEALVALADNMPTQDAPIVERMKNAGAIPVARTNMPDLGLRVHTDNALHGATINPWDAGLTCGGSSGGEGVAIATGMSPMGLGNDIGGSVRNPAYCSGIVAHKPTPHRLPRASSTPPTSWGPAKQLMSVDGPMARTVEDVRAMFGAMHGRHHRDPWSVTTPFADSPPDEKPRIALVPEPEGGSTADSVSAGVHAAGEALREQGYEVVETHPPEVAAVATCWGHWLGGEIDLRRANIDPVLGPDAIRMLDLFSEVFGPQDLESTIDALTERHRLAAAWQTFFVDYPIVIGPMWTQPPFAVGFDIAGLDEAMAVTEMLRFTVVANVLGLPATSLPVGLDNTGIPLGVQVLAEQYSDDSCLSVAAAVESAFPRLTPTETDGNAA